MASATMEHSTDIATGTTNSAAQPASTLPLQHLAPLVPHSTFVPAALHISPEAPHAITESNVMWLTSHDLAITHEYPRTLADLAALTFLKRIERIEINDTHKRAGKTFYVLDVFLHRLDSASSDTHTARNGRSPSTARLPDYQVERRFSDFVALRALVHNEIFLDLVIAPCQFCADFAVCMRWKALQPRAVTKLAPIPVLRKPLLASFVNAFVRLGRRDERQNARCRYHRTVAQHIEAFVRNTDASITANTSTSASALCDTANT